MVILINNIIYLIFLIVFKIYWYKKHCPSYTFMKKKNTCTNLYNFSLFYKKTAKYITHLALQKYGSRIINIEK